MLFFEVGGRGEDGERCSGASRNSEMKRLLKYPPHTERRRTIRTEFGRSVPVIYILPGRLIPNIRFRKKKIKQVFLTL